MTTGESMAGGGCRLEGGATKSAKTRLVGVEKGVEGGSELGTRPILLADDFAGDAAVAGDEIDLREHRGAVILGNVAYSGIGGAGIAIGGDVGVEFGQKLLICGGIIVLAGPHPSSTLAGNALVTSA